MYLFPVLGFLIFYLFDYASRKTAAMDKWFSEVQCSGFPNSSRADFSCVT
jgi:hypothetical protein